MNYYFKLLFRMFYREITDFNIHPVLIILFLAGAFTGASEVVFRRIVFPEYSYATAALVVAFFLGGKARNEFLKNLFLQKKYRLIRWGENMFTILPFVIFLVYKGGYVVSGILIILASLLSLYNKAGQSFYTIPSPFSKRPYEFTVGFRSLWLLFVCIYILETIAIYVGNVNLGILTLLLIFAVCQYFYFKVEPVVFVWMHKQTAAVFIRKKVATAVLYSVLLALPCALALIVFSPSNTLWILLALCAGMLYSITAAMVKYASYPEDPFMFLQILVAIGLFLPPVCILLIPYFYQKSLKSLKPVLK